MFSLELLLLLRPMKLDKQILAQISENMMRAVIIHYS